jgi:tetratricopeptide (TPR) repeat protein
MRRRAAAFVAPLLVCAAVSGASAAAGADLPPAAALAGRLAAAESEHFVVRYDPDRDGVLAEPALEALEAGYAAVGTWLGERPAAKLGVTIAPTVEDFGRVSGFGRREIVTAGALGASSADGIVLLSPRLLARGYPWRDALNHEYLRALLARLGAARAPVWFTEGLARYAEGLWRGATPGALDQLERTLVARALREGRLIRLADLAPALAALPSGEAAWLARAECALAFEALVGREPAAGVRAVIARLAAAPASGGDGDDALAAAIGEPLERFEERWRRSLEARGFVESAGATVPACRLAADGDAEERDLAELQPPEAQKHLRLGDLLRARGNARAGLMEYEKALALAPASPYAGVKTARALLELGKAAAAADAARAALGAGGACGSSPAANVLHAAALRALGDRDGAVAALRGALELNPFDPFAWRDLGRDLRKLGRAREAQQASVTALRLLPGNEAFLRSVMQDE